ncbi:cupin domain-containing protein [Actinacidiphila glaucinigra]|uniref:cupin domain-containing protein n=1 Tax=Actinacidiphila glaucinigra TaxID=235986 RepID=UPI003671B413
MAETNRIAEIRNEATVTFSLAELDPEDPRWNKRGALYVPAGEGPTVWAVGDTYTIKATGDQTNGGFGFIEATVPPGGGTSPHAHGDEEETFYILDGELEFLDGDHIFTARTGDFIHVPRGTRHRFKNKSHHAARMIFMFTPPGAEKFIRDYSVPARPGEPAPPISEADAERAQEAIRRINMAVLPEPS